MDKLDDKNIRSIPIKDFWNMLGGSIGGSNLGEWMEFCGKEEYKDLNVSEKRDLFNKISDTRNNSYDSI